MQKKSEDYLWWQKGIIYEVYVRSFQDSDGDGIGDLQGIISRLDYLKWLGVDAVWVTPFYPSPMKDFGYDISDYKGIHELFGAMSDFEQLVEEVHKRNLKIVLDFVPNHSSDQHPWFKESRSSKDNPRHDWYLWHDPNPEGGAPNNWLSVLGGTGWEFVKELDQFYYHAFLKEQPDFNWRNPEVQQAMLDVMRFWLDKKIDGFRVDVMWHMIKDDRWRNNPLNPGYDASQPTYDRFAPVYNTDQPGVHDAVTLMREQVDQYPEKVIIGEMYLPVDKVVDYYGYDNRGAHLPGNFQLLLVSWKAREIALGIDKYEGALPNDAWPNWVIGNHDRPRVATRYGQAQARVAAMLLLTLRGTPTLYYGDETGMRNVPIPPDLMVDPQGLNGGESRDPQRTPMQWDDSPSAGFTTGEPWLPLPENYEEENVKVQREDPASMLSLYRRLIALRKAEPALHIGDYAPAPADGDIVAYLREREGKRLLVVLNLGEQPVEYKPEQFRFNGRIVLGTDHRREGEELHRLKLAGNEGVVIELTQKS
jgi:alpha-glucosidase